MDQVFKALSDPTRRALLDALFVEDGQTHGALCARFDMTRIGMAKHLRVLEESLGSCSDPAVLDAATRQDRLILTLDRGFGDVRAYPPGNHPGKIVIRPTDASPP